MREPQQLAGEVLFSAEPVAAEVSDPVMLLDDLLGSPANPAAKEQKVVRLRPHARRLMWSALLLIALAAVVPYVVWGLVEEWQRWGLLAGALMVLLVFVIGPFFGWIARTTTITTRRIIVRSGVFTRHRSELPLAQIRELKLRRGPVQRLFGAGDVVLQWGVSDPFVLRNLPRVKSVAAALQELIEWQYASQVHAAQSGYVAPAQQGEYGRFSSGV